jgi:hypothetical protein
MARGSIDIDAQLDRMEAEGPLDLRGVDYTVADPALLRERLAPALDYFSRVEREVERNVLELQVLLPDADDRTRRFIRVWEEQELPHGWVFDRLQAELGLPPSEPNLDRLGLSLRVAGVLAHVPGVHDALMYFYLTMGAMHERLTATGYDLLRDRLLELGAAGFAHTAVAPIRGQESTHYAYYRNAALLQRQRLQGWQLHLVRVLHQVTYQPIGVQERRQRSHFGATALHLSRTDDMTAFAAPVQKVADQLLRRQGDGLRLPRFVVRAMRDCVEAYRREQPERAALVLS